MDLFAVISPCYAATDKRTWKIHDVARRVVTLPFPRGGDGSAASQQTVFLADAGLL